VLGPALSPYAFGFFSFRVQFPEDYPSCAPHVVFLTTAGGKTRFNPNLYADGKVSRLPPSLTYLMRELNFVSTILFGWEPEFLSVIEMARKRFA
jgi:hypothetical protein